MKVILGEKVYEVDRGLCDALLETAKSVCTPPCIYAVEKDDVVEMRNHTYRTTLAFNKSKQSYVGRGYTVYAVRKESV